MSSQPFRVSIFPYIPDLAGDKLVGLKKFIAEEFEKITGEQIIVSSDADPYSLEKLKTEYLSNTDAAYDVMEVDTVLLGELVSSGRLQPLEEHFEVTEDEFAPSAVHCVRYSQEMKEHLYGVPTLQCASFLMELTEENHQPPSPLLDDWQSFDQLKAALDEAEAETNHQIFMAGDFRGSWGLPMFYLDAYVDEHGAKKLYEGIDGPVDQDLVDADIKEFVDFGKLPNGKNPDIDGTFHENHIKLVEMVVDSKHILLYGYSESLGEILQKAAEKKRNKRALSIVSPPLGDTNKLLTYTDAVVVNASKFSNPQRASLIIKFVKFYTSLDFRTKFALGKDFPPSVKHPRYVLPARTAFFSHDNVKDDPHYKEFHAALLNHSTPAPNHGIYSKRKALEHSLEKALGIAPKAYTQIK